MSLQKSIFVAAVLTLGISAPAGAQTCTTDKDCPQSFTCVNSGVVNGGAPACPPNADCARLADAGSQTTIMTCEPKACSADADCGAGMVCYTNVEQSCSGGGAEAPCPANTRCDGGVITQIMSTCTTTTTKVCAFKWQLPCNAAADCGGGFTCQPDVSYTCSGGGAAGGAGTSSGTGTTSVGSSSTGSGHSTGASAPIDGGSAPVAVDAASPPTFVDAGTIGTGLLDGGTATSCMTMSSFPGYCELKVTTCTADTDCPAGWKCTDVSTAVETSGSPSTGGATGAPASTGGAAAIGIDGGGTKACVSPLGGGYGYPLRGGAPAGDAPQTSGTGTNGAGGTTGAKGGGALGASNAGASSSSGCSLAGGGAEPVGLVLLALVVVRRARRRSR